MALNRPKDKIKFKFNPIEGTFDMVQEFNADRIVTHQLTPKANPVMFFDPVVGEYYQADDLIVTDSNGNVVTV